MFQENELVNLFSGIIGMVILLSFGNRAKMAQFRFFYVAFAFMLGAYVATVVEGVVWPTFLNIVEHAMLALAGLSFAVACRSLCKTAYRGEEPGSDS